MDRDVALGIVRELYGTQPFSVRKALSELIPGLVRKEDRAIKETLKELVVNGGTSCYVNGIHKDEILAWLEKQDKEKFPIERLPVEMKTVSESLGFTTQKECGDYNKMVTDLIMSDGDKGEPKFKVGDEIKTANEESLTITKIDEKGYWSKDLFICSFGEECIWDLVERKPTDKVEPKFKVGDWVVYDRNDSSREILHVYGIRDGRYYFNDNIHFSWSVKECDEKCHLWTIQDAKPGDVLYHKAENGIEYIVMNKGLNEHNNIDSYFRYNSINGFGTDIPSVLSAKCDSITPATKEQHDLLFQKMKEDGYEWDAENKELKETGNEEYNGEDYGIDSLWHAKNILEETLGKVDGYQTDDGILEHKCAITAVNKLYKQKPAEWSEEDEKMIGRIRGMIEAYAFSQSAVDVNGDLCEKKFIDADIWLKSLRQRIGG